MFDRIKLLSFFGSFLTKRSFINRKLFFVNCQCSCIQFGNIRSTRLKATVYLPLPVCFYLTPLKFRIPLDLSFTVAEVLFRYNQIVSTNFSSCRLDTFKVFNWIRIIKELRVLIAIILNFLVSLITYTIWKIVRDAIAVAHMSLFTERVYHLEL